MKKTHLILIVLLLLFAFHVVNNIIIISRDTTPFIADASEYYNQSVYYWKAAIHFIKFGNFQMIKSIFHMGLQGQLPCIIALPFYSVMGVSHDAAIIANQLFFLILILSIFGIGKALFNGVVGFLSAFIISFYPAIFGFSRVYMVEFPAVAISALCIFLLIKSDGFKNLKYSIYFGLAFGLGELLRPRFVIYLIFPILYYIVRNIIIIYSKKTDIPAKSFVKKMMINIFFSAASFYLIIFPWYSLGDIFEYINYQKAWSTLPHFSKINSTLLYYLQMLAGAQLHWFFTSLFLAGLTISFFSQDKNKKICFLLIWLVFSLTLLSSFGLRNYSRLVIPLCIPIVLISSAGLEKLLRRNYGKCVLFILLSFIIAQYFFISYNKMAGKGIYSSMAVINRASGRKYFYEIGLSQGLLQANNDDWKINEIISSFKMRYNLNKEFNWRHINKKLVHLKGLSFIDSAEDFIKVLFIEFRGMPIINEIDERIFFDNLPITCVGLYPDEFDYKKLFSDKELQHMVLGADYVVLFEIEPESELISKIVNIFNKNISKFEKLKTIETPWSECLIYGIKTI